MRAGRVAWRDAARESARRRSCSPLRLPGRQVLGKLDTLVKDWVRRVSAAKGFTEPLLSEVRQPASGRARRGALPTLTWA